MVIEGLIRLLLTVGVAFVVGKLVSKLRLPAILAAVIVGLLIIRAVLAVLMPSFSGTADTLPEDVPDAPEWVERQLLPINEYSRPGEKLTAVNGVVVHYTGNPSTTAQQNRSYFAGLAQSGEYESADMLIKAADKRMYIDKENTERNRHGIRP